MGSADSLLFFGIVALVMLVGYGLVILHFALDGRRERRPRVIAVRSGSDTAEGAGPLSAAQDVRIQGQSAMLGGMDLSVPLRAAFEHQTPLLADGEVARTGPVERRPLSS